MKAIGMSRFVVVMFVCAATWQAARAQSQQPGPPLLVMVTEQRLRPALIGQWEQGSRNALIGLARVKRPFPYTLMTADDGRWVFVTRGLRDLSDWERYNQANIVARQNSPGPLPGPPTLPVDYANQWFMLERPDWSYTPSSPRLKAEDIGFVHWDVYYSGGGPARWGLTAGEGTAAGFLPEPNFFAQLVALHRQRNIPDGFTVYTTYAQSNPGGGGGGFVIETSARDAKDYYTQLVRTQRLLGEEGLGLMVARLALSRKIERTDFNVRRDLSYRGPTN